MTRARDVADTQDNTGGAVAPFVAGKNKIINGDFGVWQRGTSFTNPTVNQYLADRWFFGGGSNFTGTISAQTFSPGSAPVAGYEGTNYWRFNGTATTPVLGQRIEDVRTLAGQTVTLSFWARANTSITTGVANIYQYFGTGGSSGVDNPTPLGVTLTTSWTRYSFTINLASISGKTIGTGSYIFAFINIPNISSNTIDFWGWQLEAGNVATPFTTATGTLAGELAACQRYLPAFRGEYSPLNGWFTSTTNGNWVYNFPVPARVAPTGITISAASDFQLINKAIAAVSPTAITWNYGGTSAASVSTTHTAGSPTSAQGEVGFLRASTSSAYILFTGCEL